MLNDFRGKLFNIHELQLPHHQKNLSVAASGTLTNTAGIFNMYNRSYLVEKTLELDRGSISNLVTY